MSIETLKNGNLQELIEFERIIDLGECIPSDNKKKDRGLKMDNRSCYLSESLVFNNGSIILLKLSLEIIR